MDSLPPHHLESSQSRILEEIRKGPDSEEILYAMSKSLDFMGAVIKDSAEEWYDQFYVLVELF